MIQLWMLRPPRRFICAAAAVGAVVDHHLVAGRGEVARHRQAGRAGADAGDALAVARRHRWHARGHVALEVGGNALEAANRRPNLVFLDIWLQGSKLDGLQLLEQIKRDHPEVPVVMISGHGNIETAVAAIKRGAYDFIEKPFKADRLILVATRALETSRLKREVKELKQLTPIASSLTGRSAAMNQLRQTIDR
eukprot:gene30702-40824_t